MLVELESGGGRQLPTRASANETELCSEDSEWSVRLMADRVLAEPDQPANCHRPPWKQCVCHSDAYQPSKPFLCAVFDRLCHQRCHCEHCRRQLLKPDIDTRH